jgi:isoleucyl-tRNA synthetase
VLKDERVNKRIADAFEKEGADAGFADKDGARFLAPDYKPADYEKVNDILDVWFDSGSTHAFTLEVRPDLKAKRPPAGKDRVLYLEGSDQHRGWFQSSGSCGTRGRPPFDIVLTHGFILDEKGEEKMSKSRGNIASPQQVTSLYGADILRLWVAASDYADDIRYGPEVLKNFVEAYRKLRNTLRWLLGSQHHFKEADRVAFEKMPELERLILHQLKELDETVRRGYAEFDYKRVFAALNSFMNTELSAFYFDVRKDALYCDPISSVTRKACLTVLDELHKCLCTWLAPVLVFTAEEVWLARHPSETGSVHLQTFPDVPPRWRDEVLAEKWRKIRLVRRVVTGALEVERAQKRIGASLEADPFVYVTDSDLFAALVEVDLAEICITSAATLVEGEGPADAFRLPEVPGVAVVTNLAEGTKCARSGRFRPRFSISNILTWPSDARALREFHAAPAREGSRSLSRSGSMSPRRR